MFQDKGKAITYELTNFGLFGIHTLLNVLWSKQIKRPKPKKECMEYDCYCYVYDDLSADWFSVYITG